MSALRLGACSVALRALEPAAVVDAVAAAGLEGVEWGGDVHLPPGDEARAAELGERCAAAGLATPSYGSYLRAGVGLDAAAVLATAAALGAATVRVWAGDRPSAGADARYRRAVARDLARWSIEAAALGLTVSLELHAGTLTDTADSTRRLLVDADAAGAPAGGLWTYWQPRDGDAGDHDLRELLGLADRLAHVHVFWWRSWLERFALADGGAFWREALRIASGAPGDFGPRWALIEFVRDDAPDQLARDAVALRSWC